MDHMNEICCVCVSVKQNLKQLIESDGEDLSYYYKLTSSIPVMNFQELTNQRWLCTECCSSVDTIHSFRQKCLQSKPKLINYYLRKHPLSPIHIKTKEEDFTMSESENVDNEDNFEFVSVNTSQNADENTDEVSTEFNLEKVKLEKIDSVIDYEETGGYNDLSSDLNVNEIKTEPDIHGSLTSFEKQNQLGSTMTLNKEKTPTDSLYIPNRIHTGEKPHECKVCEKKFSLFSALIVHKRIHNDEKPNELGILPRHKLTHEDKKTKNECNICGKKFTRLNHVQKHIRLHTGEKPFECHICNRKFTDSSNATKHMKTHTEINTEEYECDVCNKKFRNTFLLKSHRRIHTGEKPYECSVCHKKFGYLSNLSRHTKLHIGENTC